MLRNVTKLKLPLKLNVALCERRGTNKKENNIFNLNI